MTSDMFYSSIGSHTVPEIGHNMSDDQGFWLSEYSDRIYVECRLNSHHAGRQGVSGVTPEVNLRKRVTHICLHQV